MGQSKHTVVGDAFQSMEAPLLHRQEHWMSLANAANVVRHAGAWPAGRGNSKDSPFVPCEGIHLVMYFLAIPLRCM
jgi:hypothetical protein